MRHTLKSFVKRTALRSRCQLFPFLTFLCNNKFASQLATPLAENASQMLICQSLCGERRPPFDIFREPASSFKRSDLAAGFFLPFRQLFSSNRCSFPSPAACVSFPQKIALLRAIRASASSSRRPDARELGRKLAAISFLSLSADESGATRSRWAVRRVHPAVRRSGLATLGLR